MGLGGEGASVFTEDSRIIRQRLSTSDQEGSTVLGHTMNIVVASR